MKSIDFNDSFKEYIINGDNSRKIRIKIMPDIMEKIESAMSEFEKIKDEINGISDEKISEKLSRKACEIINNAFGSDICTPAFNGDNIFSLVDGGKYLFEAFFEVFIPAFQEDVNEFKKSFNARPEMQKYLKKS